MLLQKKGLTIAVCLLLFGCDDGANKAKLEFKAATGATPVISATAPKRNDALTTAAPIRTQLAELTTTGAEFIRLTGTLHPDERSAVAARVAGVVMDVPVDRGMMVRKGDVLATLDPTDAQNALAEGRASADETRVRLGMQDGQSEFKPENQPEVQQAMSKLDLARTVNARVASLIKQNVLPQSEGDKTASELQTAEQAYNQQLAEARRLYQSYSSSLTRLKTLEQTVAYTQVTAPFDGMIAEKLASVGERLSPGGSLGNVVTLVRIDPVRLYLTVSERDLPFIRKGEELEFTVAAFPDRIFKSTVARIGAELDSKTRALLIECTASNPDAVLLPGMFAIARLPLNGVKRVPLGVSALDPPTTATAASEEQE